MSGPTATAVEDAPGGTSGTRVAGLDGLRGLAALFVVVHHCYLAAFPGYPRASGPWWTGWMIYGHLAVVVFIVLSGFSLAVGPARHGWRVGSLGRYAHRRAWRILSAYWPALVLSILMAWLLVPQPGEGRPGLRSALVFGLLVQDVVGAPSPNGAFWSIAVEAQLYVLLPLLLVLLRRAGAAVMVLAVLGPVLVVGTLSGSVPLIDLFTRFTPQLAVGFALGVAAARIAQRARGRRVPLLAAALLAAVPPLTLIAVMGSTWTVRHYFWVDLAVLPAIAALLAALGAGRAVRVGRLLDVRPLRSLGAFSYSLYLVHAPIVVAVAELVVRPRTGPGPAALGAMLLIALPLAVAGSRLFAAVFDLPFQRHRDWPELRAALRARLSAGPRPPLAPAAVIEPEVSPATRSGG